MFREWSERCRARLLRPLGLVVRPGVCMASIRLTSGQGMEWRLEFICSDERYLKYAIAMGEWFMNHLPEDKVQC